LPTKVLARAGSKSLDRGSSSLPSHLRRRPDAGPVVFVRIPSSSWLEALSIVFASFQIKCDVRSEWAQVESNYRPYPYQGYALAN
jgi:hypothetical protein